MKLTVLNEKYGTLMIQVQVFVLHLDKSQTHQHVMQLHVCKTNCFVVTVN